jgi:hypothetical protein
MFPRTPPPIYRPRGSVRRFYFPLIVVVAFAVCQLHKSLCMWPTGPNELVHHRQEVIPPRPNDDQTQSTAQELPWEWNPNALRRKDDHVHFRKNAGLGPTPEASRSEPSPRAYNSGRYGQAMFDDSHDDSSGRDDVAEFVTQGEEGDLVLDHAIIQAQSSHGKLPMPASEHSTHKHNLDTHDKENFGRQSDFDFDEKQEFLGAAVQDKDGDQLQSPIQVLREMSAWSEDYRFPSRDECNEVREKADTLPDMVFVLFEDAVADMELMGWEDLWVSKARYAGPKLSEPKIDFLYNCE